MHVLITTDVVGGVWSYAVQLCRSLANFRVQVSLAVLGPPTRPWHRKELQRLHNVELFERNCRLEWMDDSERDVEASGEWLLSLASKQRADLVHLNGYMHGALDWQLPVIVVAHSCLMSWWTAVHRFPLPSGLETYRSRVSRGLQQADVVVAPSKAMLDEIQRLYGPLSNCLAIPNGRNARDFPAGRKEELILSTGRLWDAAKNLRRLEKIAPSLPWPVYLAGSRAHPDGSSAEFQNVVLLGELSSVELRPWFSRAAIYAAPALYEPFGLSVLESALAGCALVLNDIPSFRENWDRAAIFAGDDDSFQSAILRLIADEHERRRCATLCATRAQQFSSRAMSCRYLEAYATARRRFLTRAMPATKERIA